MKHHQMSLHNNTWVDIAKVVDSLSELNRRNVMDDNRSSFLFSLMADLPLQAQILSPTNSDSFLIHHLTLPKPDSHLKHKCGETY